MDDRASYLATNLKFLIPASGKGFREFARDNEIHYSLLKRYISGGVLPKPPKVRRMAESLGVSPGALVYENLVPATQML
tara:strand:+ start:1039 stop:1275 length:237 start_codon:yes stop_codon:yes gene_type:complete